MDKLKLKAIGILGVIILVANVFLFSFRIITPLLFWIIIALMAGVAYWGVPKLKNSIPS